MFGRFLRSERSLAPSMKILSFLMKFIYVLWEELSQDSFPGFRGCKGTRLLKGSSLESIIGTRIPVKDEEGYMVVMIGMETVGVQVRLFEVDA